MKQLFIFFTALVIFLLACRKTDVTNTSGTSFNSTGPADTSHHNPIDTNHYPPIDTTHYTPTDTLPFDTNAILIDASKDGGGWWFPQGPATGFVATNYHQGTNLAIYLRSLGYRVDELSRGAVITTELLNKYSKIIRPSAFFNYTLAEVAAYETFLSRPTSLLLMSEHMMYTVNDRLSAHIGLNFEGVVYGPITSFQAHPVTAGVNSISYVAGSVIKSWDPSKITVLGTLNLPGGGEGSAAGAMGIVHHPSSKIFFIGDIGAIENLSQPFTSNVVKWLFR